MISDLIQFKIKSLNIENVAHRLFIPLIILLLFYYPVIIPLPAAQLDPDWHMGISYALLNGMQFGKDIVYTYGPLGSIYNTGPIPDLHIFSKIYWAILCAGLIFFIHDTNDKKNYLVFIYILLAPLVYIKNLDAFIYASLLIFASRKSYPISHSILISILIAAFSLSKFTFFVAGIVLLIYITIELSNAKNRLIFIGTFIATLFFLLVASSQSIFNFISYVRGGLEISSGFSEAMSSYNSRLELLLAGLLIILYISIIFPPKESLKNLLDKGNIKFLVKLFLLWIAFKQGFTRHDGHALTFISYIFFAFTLEISTWDINKIKLKAKIVFIVLLIWIYLLANASTNHKFDSSLNGFITSIENNLSRLMTENSAEIIKNNYKNEIDKIRALSEIKINKNESADSGSIMITSLLANDMIWQPRPIIQSYSSYTPYLAKINQAAYSNSNRPDNIYIDLVSIDGHYPLQEDPLIWSELLKNYDLKSYANIIHFKKTESNISLIEKDLTVSLVDDYWKVEQKDYTYFTISISLKNSIFRSISALAFKSDPLFIEFSLANGSKRKFKFITSLKNTPFIASPLIGNTAELSLLNCLCSEMQDLKVKSFKIIDSNGFSQELNSPPVIKAYTLSKDKYNPPANLEDLSLLSNMQVLSGIDHIKEFKILNENKTSIINAHTPAAHTLNNKYQKKINLCYGVRDGAINQNDFDGIQFTVTDQTKNKVLINKILDPKISKESKYCSEIILPANTEIKFETSPIKTAAYDWAFWSISVIR